MWYVNGNDDKTSSDLDISFILTMWYVNMQYSNKKIKYKSWFYINYVVCKLEVLMMNSLMY